MKKILLSKKIYILIIILCLSLAIKYSFLEKTFAQQDNSAFSKNVISLNDSNTSWYTVLGGKSITKPIRTNVGFNVITDGRLLISCSSTGKILWQKNIKTKTAPFFVSSFSDMFYIVSQNAKLSLYNPSGLQLWEVSLKEFPIENPHVGNDGRVFIKASNSISCYGMQGKRKWIVSTEKQSNIPLLFFPDGSILSILAKEKNNCSQAIRITQYGQITEELTFTNKVVCSTFNKNGVSLGFENGIIGCINLNSNTLNCETIWNYTDDQNNNSIKNIFSDDKNNLYVIYSNNEIVCINSNNQQKKWTVKTNVNLSSISDFYSDSSTVYFITGSNTVCINNNGILQNIYSYNYGLKSYPLFLNNGYLIFSTESWCINAYRIYQKLENSKKTIKTPTAYNIQKYIPQKKFSIDECYQKISKANYSQDEKDILKILSNNINSIYQSYYQINSTENEVFNILNDNNLANKAKALQLCGEMGLGIYTDIFSTVIQKEVETTLLIAALQGCTLQGYDDGSILQAIEILSRKPLVKNNLLLQKEICNSVYSICRFMGRPAVFSKGKDILVYLLTGTTNDESKEFARQTMEKIIALQM